jgi:large subunit ribosomal protein L29
MKAKEIRELTTQEIKEKVAETKKEIVRLRLNHAVSPLEQPHKLGLLRKDVARLLTILGQRALSEQK